MEELEIAIDDLKLKKSDLQLLMQKPFDYGRSPPDNEYTKITSIGIELAKVEAQLSALMEALESIKHNAAIKLARGE